MGSVFVFVVVVVGLVFFAVETASFQREEPLQAVGPNVFHFRNKFSEALFHAERERKKHQRLENSDSVFLSLNSIGGERERVKEGFVCLCVLLMVSRKFVSDGNGTEKLCSALSLSVQMGIYAIYFLTRKGHK